MLHTTLLRGGDLVFTGGDHVCRQIPQAGAETKDDKVEIVVADTCPNDPDDEDVDSGGGGGAPAGSPAQAGTPEYQLCEEAETEWQKQEIGDQTGRSC